MEENIYVISRYKTGKEKVRTRKNGKKATVVVWPVFFKEKNEISEGEVFVSYKLQNEIRKMFNSNKNLIALQIEVSREKSKKFMTKMLKSIDKDFIK